LITMAITVWFVAGCCIYHKEKGFGESSTESDTSDASTNTDETDYDTDDTRAKKKRRERVRRRRERYRRKYLGEQYGASEESHSSNSLVNDPKLHNQKSLFTKCQRCGHQHEMPENEDDDTSSSSSNSS
jgi:transcription elongation factor Elf1